MFDVFAPMNALEAESDRVSSLSLNEALPMLEEETAGVESSAPEKVPPNTFGADNPKAVVPPTDANPLVDVAGQSHALGTPLPNPTVVADDPKSIVPPTDANPDNEDGRIPKLQGC